MSVCEWWLPLGQKTWLLKGRVSAVRTEHLAITGSCQQALLAARTRANERV